MQFTVSGTINLNGKRNFTKTLEAKSERHARDLVYALFGQHNGLPRNRIAIEKVGKK
ncbi:MAG TPA: 50S ribosomal protein L18Ae [Candidatus Bilamarchaeaceae archaeon]|nr:50S ribosomal protein L18Ae [Candidatus Bilamarchaeaceae archaeon]